MRAAIATIVFSVLALPAAAGDYEITLELRFQPDDTGARTENKEVQFDGDGITIEENGPGLRVYEERPATAEDGRLLEAFLRERFAAVEFAGGERVRRPSVEVKIEFDGETREVEITETYPAGDVPAAVVALQRRFFSAAFE